MKGEVVEERRERGTGEVGEERRETEGEVWWRWESTSRRALNLDGDVRSVSTRTGW